MKERFLLDEGLVQYTAENVVELGFLRDTEMSVFFKNDVSVPNWNLDRFLIQVRLNCLRQARAFFSKSNIIINKE